MREKYADDSQQDSCETIEEGEKESSDSEIGYNDPVRKSKRRTSLIDRQDTPYKPRKKQPLLDSPTKAQVVASSVNTDN